MCVAANALNISLNSVIIEYICIGVRQLIGELDENDNLVVSSQVIQVFIGK